MLFPLKTFSRNISRPCFKTSSINTFLKNCLNGKIVYDNDVGFKNDILWATHLLLNSGRFAGATTSLYNPNEKKENVSATVIEHQHYTNWLENQEEPLVVSTTGSMSNIATSLRKNPTLVKNKIKSIITLNQIFSNPPEMGLNMHDIEVVFNSEIPIFIVPFHFCKKFTLHLKKVQHLQEGRVKDLKSSPPVFTDSLIALLAIRPDFILNIHPVKYQFHHDLMNNNDGNPINHLHKRIPELVTIKDDQDSNVFKVSSLANEEEIQKILEENASILTFHKKKL